VAVQLRPIAAVGQEGVKLLEAHGSDRGLPPV
jgi:hypothetical protein